MKWLNKKFFETLLWAIFGVLITNGTFVVLVNPNITEMSYVAGVWILSCLIIPWLVEKKFKIKNPNRFWVLVMGIVSPVFAILIGILVLTLFFVEWLPKKLGDIE